MYKSRRQLNASNPPLTLFPHLSADPGRIEPPSPPACHPRGSESRLLKSETIPYTKDVEPP